MLAVQRSSIGSRGVFLRMSTGSMAGYWIRESIVAHVIGIVGQRSFTPDRSIALPVGISFFTFQAISYVVDVYRGETRAASLMDVAILQAFFPHLVAGPIVRFTDLHRQLRRPVVLLTPRIAAIGLFFLSCGLMKKLLLADQLSPDVDRLFANASELQLVSAWAAAIGYSLQLYFDFSGYSDMAVGLAWLLGFRFPQNFDSPYKARNISDFWRRWNMTLSAWIRDYIYIPLGGSRRGPTRTATNLVVTMFLAGLWHGAAWTFVVWGLIHGTLLAGHAGLRRAGLTPSSVAVNRAVTFAVVVAAFVVFRAPDLRTAATVLASMVGLSGIESGAQLDVLLPLEFAVLTAALLVFVNVAPNTWEIRAAPRARSASSSSGTRAGGPRCRRGRGRSRRGSWGSRSASGPPRLVLTGRVRQAPVGGLPRC